MVRPASLPEAWHQLVLTQPQDDRHKARTIADYIAGMTDRFAVQEHRRLFSTETMI
jgi:dGTPase